MVGKVLNYKDVNGKQGSKKRRRIHCHVSAEWRVRAKGTLARPASHVQNR